VTALDNALHSWEFEPDEPNFTPRISGCVFGGAALSVIKRDGCGCAVRMYFEVPTASGRGKLIATYTGVNENPLPSFSGEPIDVGIPYATADEAARAMYEALAPRPGKDDYRVAVAAVFQDRDGDISISVKNRKE
jgi:IMP cyclohydrolase